MTEIWIYTSAGKMLAKPFEINDVASALAEQEENTNLPVGEVQEQNKDSEAPKNIAED